MICVTFREQLIITVIDKALIGGLVVLAGYGLNRVLDRFRHDLGLDATRRELTLQSQIRFKEKQMGDFYGPIYALLKRIRPIDDLWTKREVTEIDETIRGVIRDSNNRIVE